MGKDALNAKTRKYFFMDPIELTLVTDKAHPLYDPRVEREPEERLVRNIISYGVKNPILVRKNGDKVEVVAGRQRTKAAIEANKRLERDGFEKILVPVIPARGDDKSMVGVMILENELRQDDNPFEKANKALNLYNAGWGEDELATVFGVTEQTIGNWLRLHDLSDSVKDAVQAGDLSASAAGELAHLDREEQDKQLEELQTDGEKLTAAKVRNAVQEKDGKPPVKLRPKREIMKIMEVVQSRDDERSQAFLECLQWLMGGESAFLEAQASASEIEE